MIATYGHKFAQPHPTNRFDITAYRDDFVITDLDLSHHYVLPCATILDPPFVFHDWLVPAYLKQLIQHYDANRINTQLADSSSTICSSPLQLNSTLVHSRHSKALASSTGTLSTLDHTGARPKDITSLIPSPLVVVVQVKSKPARALLDSGSMADFIRPLLRINFLSLKEPLVKPIPVQLAVTGSHTMTNYSVTAILNYQGISET